MLKAVRVRTHTSTLEMKCSEKAKPIKPFTLKQFVTIKTRVSDNVPTNRMSKCIYSLCVLQFVLSPLMFQIQKV